MNMNWTNGWTKAVAAMLVLAAVGIGAAGVSETSKRVHDKGKYKASMRYPSLSKDAKWNEAQNAIARFAEAQFSEFVKNAKQNPQRHEWEFTSSYTWCLNRADAKSLVFETFDYSGGAHPNTTLKPFTFVFRGGKVSQVRLKDLLLPGKSGSGFVSQVLLPALNRIKSSRGADHVESLETGLEDSFVVTPGGITFVFQRYAVGAYAEGDYWVKFSWASVSEWLKPL